MTEKNEANNEDCGENFFEEGAPRTITTLQNDSVSSVEEEPHKQFVSTITSEDHSSEYAGDDVKAKERMSHKLVVEEGVAEGVEEIEVMEEEEFSRQTSVFVDSPTHLLQREGIRFSLLPRKSTDRFTLNMEYNFLFDSGDNDMIMSISQDTTKFCFPFDDTNMWTRIVDFYEMQESDLELKTTHNSPRRSRSFFYDKLVDLKDQKMLLKIKNILIHRRLAMYYRRRNMDYILQDAEFQPKEQEKYKMRLKEYDDVLTADAIQRRAINAQLNYLNEAKALKLKKVTELFNDFQKRIKTVGTGLIFSKTATELPQKIIEHLIHRQQAIHQELSELRLKYIKIKIMVSDKEEEIENLNHIDENHHLNYYQKLVDENTAYLDKIEEKEEELTRLRYRCNETIQSLAHIREKMSAFDDDNCHMDTVFYQTSFTVNQLRASVTNTKKERDFYRSMYVRLKEDSGLLQHVELLKDMEFLMSEVTNLKKELDFLKHNCSSTASKIRCIRKKMENILEAPKIKEQTKRDFKHSRLKKVNALPFIRKPASVQPIIPPNAFDHLNQEFQPTIRRIFIQK